MEIAERRKFSELISLYSLEPELKDIYVEGVTDKLVIERFLKKNKIFDFKTIEIDTINLRELYDTYPDIKKNNKKKLTTLSAELSKCFPEPLKKVCCVADKDYDEFLGALLSNNHLLYTDFTCFEMYLFNADCLRIFYKTVLRNFPVTPSKTLKELRDVLKDKFLIRLTIQIIDEIDKEETITDLKKSAKPDKKTGKIEFNYREHLHKILSNNFLGSRQEYYEKCIEKEREKCCEEYRNHIRGHDFIHLLFIYINKIKNNISLSEEALERSLYQCIDYSKLKQYNLFVTLQNKYN